LGVLARSYVFLWFGAYIAGVSGADTPLDLALAVVVTCRCSHRS
jgi:hypothetical protein